MFYRLKDRYKDRLRELRRIVNKDPRILDELPPLYREAALRLLQEKKRDTEQGGDKGLREALPS